jgi:hypothetical protein
VLLATMVTACEARSEEPAESAAITTPR